MSSRWGYRLAKPTGGTTTPPTGCADEIVGAAPRSQVAVPESERIRFTHSSPGADIERFTCVSSSRQQDDLSLHFCETQARGWTIGDWYQVRLTKPGSGQGENVAKELVTGELWEVIEPLLPEEPPSPKAAAPRR